MPEINGKSVEFADRLPARQWWSLWQKIITIKKGDRLLEKLDWETSVSLCQAMIVSWEFENDPKDAASYETMDFLDMSDLVAAVYAHAIVLADRHGASDLGE